MERWLHGLRAGVEETALGSFPGASSALRLEAAE